MRQGLARREADGLVGREHGRGTFVRLHVPRAVLIVASAPALQALLAEHGASQLIGARTVGGHTCDCQYAAPV